MTELRWPSRVAVRLEVYTQPLLKPSLEPVLSCGLLFLLFDVFFSFSLLKFHSFTHFLFATLYVLVLRVSFFQVASPPFQYITTLVALFVQVELNGQSRLTDRTMGLYPSDV